MRREVPHPLTARERARARWARRRTRAPRELETAAEPDPPREPDTALLRARAAGGPTDRACYVCPCGFVFTAAVSTTVACPHCHTTQAW